MAFDEVVTGAGDIVELVVDEIELVANDETRSSLLLDDGKDKNDFEIIKGSNEMFEEDDDIGEEV